MNRVVLGIVLLSAIAAAVVVRWMPRGQRQAPGSEANAQSSSEELPKLWDAPPFEFASQAGRPLGNAELRGQVWIANFIFTQCTSICPTMTAKMVLLQRNLGAPQLRFVSFSVDPQNDTPTVLKEYAGIWRPSETRWWLLATDAENLARVAKGFGVTVQKTDDVDDPILHSNRFFLVDPRGLIRGAYLSDDEEAIERLIDDTNRLLAREFANSTFAQTDLSGPELFQALGCVGCHNNPRLGPPLGGALGHAVTLDDGSKLVADRAYLRESILEPHARIVAGYRGTMPIYRGALSDVQLDRLLDYVSSLPPPAGSSESPTLVYDPVCRMEITVFSDSPSTDYAGKRYWFCCEHCLERFKEEPAAFVDAKQ